MKTKIIKSNKIKKHFVKMGVDGLNQKSCVAFFHEVPVPEKLKNLEADLLNVEKTKF